MPDVDSESLGLAGFESRRRSAVERALGKIRHHLGSDWSVLSAEEIDKLGWLLGELWATRGFMSWEKIGLDSVTLLKVDRLIELTDAVRAGGRVSIAMKQAEEIFGTL